MVSKGSHKDKGKATTRAKMPTLVINRRLSLDQDGTKQFIPERIHGPIRIYNARGVKNMRAWDHSYDIIFLDPVMTGHISQLQLIWPHHWSTSSPFREWWVAISSSMGPMFDETRD